MERATRLVFESGRPIARVACDLGVPAETAPTASSTATSRGSAPNELWVADFSYLCCWEGVVFFSFVIDVYSRMVVGW